MIPPSPTSRTNRHGLVLVAVVIVITIMSLSAYSFARWMRAEARAAEMQLRTVQARYAAESAVELTRALLMGRRRGFPTANLQDAPSLFRNVALFEPDEDVHPRMRARFTVMAPVDVDLGTSQVSGVRYGTSDENAKIDLNAWALRDPAGLEQLLHSRLHLPEAIAHDLVAWISPFSERETGQAGKGNTRSFVRSFAHSSVDDYRPKQGPLASFDELLLVRGMTRELLHGREFNYELERNGLTTGSRAVPLAQVATLYSRAGETDGAGRPRIRLNQPDLSSLFRAIRAEFNESLARFVIALRVFGPGEQVGWAPPTSSDGRVVGGAHPIDPVPAIPPSDTQAASAESRATYPIRSILDLLVPEVTGVWNGQAVTIQNPLFEQGSPPADATSPSEAAMAEGNAGATPAGGKGALSDAQLLDRVTVSETDVRHGVVNVNTASAKTLAILPDLSEEERSRILATRGDMGQRQGIAWLVTENVVSPQTFRAIEPIVTGHSDVLRVRAVGSVGDRGPLVTLEAVIDATRNPPELLHYKTAGPPSHAFREALPLAEEPRPLPSDYGLPGSGTGGPTSGWTSGQTGWSGDSPAASPHTPHSAPRTGVIR